eukprot:scaffold55918_cov35-Tisochrysis_lutea.AAC.2
MGISPGCCLSVRRRVHFVSSRPQHRRWLSLAPRLSHRETSRAAEQSAHRRADGSVLLASASELCAMAFLLRGGHRWWSQAASARLQ